MATWWLRSARKNRTTVNRMAWAEDYRQNWIAETLRVFGFIQRGHLERKFGISVAQASLDLRRFQAERPAIIAYDKTAKRYVSVAGT